MIAQIIGHIVAFIFLVALIVFMIKAFLAFFFTGTDKEEKYDKW